MSNCDPLVNNYQGIGTSAGGYVGPLHTNTGICPHCGHCPHCGRGGYFYQPPYYLPSTPIYSGTAVTPPVNNFTLATGVGGFGNLTSGFVNPSSSNSI